MDAENIKAICFNAAGDPIRFCQKCPDLIAENTQHIVTEFASVQRIDRVELFNVHHDGIHV